MKPVLHFLIIAYILTSCDQNKPEKVQDIKLDIQTRKESENLDSKNSDGHEVLNKEEKQYPEIDTLFSSKLTNDWSEEIMASNILKQQFNFSADTVRNIHWPEQIDSILCYKTKASKVQIYRTLDKDILLDTDLFDSDITLSSKIKIGSSKKEVSQTLLVKIRSNILMIHDEESDMSFTFYFKNDILYQIHYNSYID